MKITISQKRTQTTKRLLQNPMTILKIELFSPSANFFPELQRSP